tara:strand:+ start:90 stop:446 length:357 start_codon:yes stop_codon:yes gene_type:complete
MITFYNGNYVVNFQQLKKNKIVFSLFIYLFIPLTPLLATEFRDHDEIELIVKSCYKDTESCNSALTKIYNYQINAARNKKFSCQTRLLGLEANLIMAMNSNLNKKDAKNIIQAVKKFC